MVDGTHFHRCAEQKRYVARITMVRRQEEQLQSYKQDIITDVINCPRLSDMLSVLEKWTTRVVDAVEDYTSSTASSSATDVLEDNDDWLFP